MRNPELIRNLWLEFTPHRLIVTPLVLLAIFYLAHESTGPLGAASVSTVAIWAYIFFVFIWGTRCASDAVCEEINNHTWDWQRTSQLKPSTMSLGKLLGSTSFTWFGAALALMAFMWFSETRDLGSKCIVLIVGGLLTQALALLFSLEALSYERQQKVKSFKYFFIALVIGGFITNNAYHASTITNIVTNISWHGTYYSVTTFSFASLVLFFIWSLVGLYRNMRIELQYRNIPWVWGAFVLYCMIYVSGFVDLKSAIDVPKLTEAKQLLDKSPIYTAFLVGAFLTYLSFLSENISKLRYQKVLTALQYKSLYAALERMPRWPVSFVLVIATGCWLAMTSGLDLKIAKASIEFKPAVFTISFLLFMSRDLLISHFFHFGKTQKKGTLTTLFYFGVLYLLIPVVLKVLQLSTLAACFWPSFGQHQVASIFGALVQVVILGYLVMSRWCEKEN